MIKVGITGGIGSGKTTVCQIFKVFNVPVYNADLEARYLTNNHTEIIKGVGNLFGEDIYVKGQLDRAKVGALAFKNKDLLAQLNAIIHPVVANHFNEWLEKHQRHMFILKEAAILFESGGHKQVDKVITVTAPQKLRIKRIISRDGLTENEIVSRINNQMSEEEKVKMSDYVVNCDGLELIIPQVINIYHEILQGC